jgi:7-cyano-7-deazaguanine reductase
LGESAEYADGYAPERLFPMPRQEGREAVSLSDFDEWSGQDVWTGYEFSWLNEKGKPVVAVLRLTVDAASTHIVESKSMKLYLNGYAQTTFASKQQVCERLGTDLGDAFGAVVTIELMDPADVALQVVDLDGQCLDELDVAIDEYRRNPALLKLKSAVDQASLGDPAVSEVLTSHLFRSLCPVTAQPDWASLSIGYTGKAIDHEGLLKYLVSYRGHQAFHETTIERIYGDIWRICEPQSLVVSGRFLRRGGLDISPTRSSVPLPVDHRRLSRQ